MPGKFVFQLDKPEKFNKAAYLAAIKDSRKLKHPSEIYSSYGPEEMGVSGVACMTASLQASMAAMAACAAACVGPHARGACTGRHCILQRRGSSTQGGGGLQARGPRGPGPCVLNGTPAGGQGASILALLYFLPGIIPHVALMGRAWPQPQPSHGRRAACHSHEPRQRQRPAPRGVNAPRSHRRPPCRLAW
jgi:hypothetical protein